MTGESCRGRRPILNRALLPACLLLAACQSGSRDFLQRTTEDCQSGDVSACELLSDLRPSAAGGVKPKQTQSPMSPVQRDVDAILEGMRHARTAPRPPQPPSAEPGASEPAPASP